MFEQQWKGLLCVRAIDFQLFFGKLWKTKRDAFIVTVLHILSETKYDTHTQIQSLGNILKRSFCFSCMIFWEGLPGDRVAGLGLTTHENQNSYGKDIAMETETVTAIK